MAEEERDTNVYFFISFFFCSNSVVVVVRNEKIVIVGHVLVSGRALNWTHNEFVEMCFFSSLIFAGDWLDVGITNAIWHYPKSTMAFGCSCSCCSCIERMEVCLSVCVRRFFIFVRLDERIWL